MKKRFLPSALLMLSAAFIFSSCNNDEETPQPKNEQEVITTLTAEFTKLSDNTKTKFTFRSAEGAVFGRTARFDTIKLEANTAYSLALEVLDESKQTPESKNPEIIREGYEHQFFFTPAPADLISVDYSTADKDRDNLPLALTLGSLRTRTTAGTGNFKITLLHDLNKRGGNVNNNDMTNAGNPVETDIEVNFPTVIR